MALTNQLSKPGVYFVVCFRAEEWAGVGMKRGRMCYDFNNVVLCSRKRSTSLFSKGKWQIGCIGRVGCSSCRRVRPARKHGLAPPSRLEC